MVRLLWLQFEVIGFYISLTAPSAPPTSVTVTGVISSTISVQWGSVPCIHQNGDITGYSVQYEVMGSGNTQTEMVSGDSSGGMTTISGLAAATMYEYQVAAMTGAGTGQYSTSMTTLTSGITGTTIILSNLFSQCFSENSKHSRVHSRSILSLHFLEQLRSSGDQL